MQKSLEKYLGWIINSVIGKNIIISISLLNPLSGTNHIRLLKELDHPKEGLINIENNNDKE